MSPNPTSVTSVGSAVRRFGLPRLGLGSRTAASLTGLVALLAVLSMTTGLTRYAWAAGVCAGVVLCALVSRGLRRAGRDAASPADVVTLSRGILTCTLAALTVDSLLGHTVTPAMLLIVVPALASDAVDGWVARRRDTVTAFGGRFDGEVDAFLILVLSVYVAPSMGWWVVSAGLMRYAFGLAAWLLPWMGRQLEYRYWRKVVAATAGISLAIAASNLLPGWSATAALLLTLTLLAESFGRDVWWLWRRRHGTDDHSLRTPDRRPSSVHGRRTSFIVPTVLADGSAIVLLWAALLTPDQTLHLSPLAVLRLPVEALVMAGVALVLPSGWARAAAVFMGALIGLLALLKALDLGSLAVLDRPFNVVTDRTQLESGVAFVRDSWGAWAAAGAVVAALALAGGIVVSVIMAVGRLAALVSRHRQWTGRAVGVLALVWGVCALSGLALTPGQPLAAAEAVQFGAEKVRTTAAALRDQQTFDHAVATDTLRDARAGELSGLRGKDVLVVFVESYGRIALEGPESEPVRALLDRRTTSLRAAGYTARSAFLTSPTFGGSSWLAHATLLSGTWVDNQWSHDRLLSGDRTTLSSAFARAGWRTVAVMPSNHGAWPEGRSFYRFDEIYDRQSLGYKGPRFGFSAMPDQYTLAAFQRLERAGSERGPVMAEVDLTSSHGPWAPLPKPVDWVQLGDGSIFDHIKASARTPQQLWSDRSQVPSGYRASIAYSLSVLLSFVESYGGDDLVVVLLGDHQPSTIVSGFGADRDVPITVIAHDRAVIDRVSGWGWQDGLRPSSRAPVWRMDAFRDRFVTAFSDRRLTGAAQGPP